MSNTRSGRTVKKVGQSETKQGALANLAAARRGESKRTDYYEQNEGKLNYPSILIYQTQIWLIY